MFSSHLFVKLWSGGIFHTPTCAISRRFHFCGQMGYACSVYVFRLTTLSMLLPVWEVLPAPANIPSPLFAFREVGCRYTECRQATQAEMLAGN